MNVEEFAKFVINNMTRATLSNALNICVKLDNDEYYKFTDFINAIYAYISDILNTDNKNIEINKIYEILVVSNKYLKMYESNIKYNKNMIIDCYIIDLWEILNGH